MYHYYIHYYMDFFNTYHLYYAPVGEPVPAEWQRITRKEAIHYCAEERKRIRNHSSFSGVADTFIFPARAGIDGNGESFRWGQLYEPWEVNGYLVPDNLIR